MKVVVAAVFAVFGMVAAMSKPIPSAEDMATDTGTPVHLFDEDFITRGSKSQKSLTAQEPHEKTVETKGQRSPMLVPASFSDEIWPFPYEKCKAGEPGYGDIFTPSAVSDVIRQFSHLYAQRPMTTQSERGLGVNHAFAVWNIVRVLQPKIIIQSGVGSGQFTWLVHKAAPKARIICLDPKEHVPHRLREALYHMGAQYKDFLTYMYEDGKQWTHSERDETLVIFDDDHNQLERLAQMKNVGIKHGIMNSNWYDDEGIGTEKVTLRQICTDWRVSKGSNISITDTVDLKEHDKATEKMSETADVYYEVPPLYLSLRGENLGGYEPGFHGFPTGVHHEVPLFDADYVFEQGLPQDPNEYQYSFIAYVHVPRYVQRKASGSVLRAGY